ncbi:hypothetical protein KY348_02725 [Candidatus Woesearchaeota archaeon]|nr:hypothetical protein [Candidatus Woesearchaeota archaeon]
MQPDLLKKIGLTKGEIKVYLALFDLGLATKTPISRKSGISQSKTYEVLDKLIKKGLVSQIVQNNVMHFQAALPSKLRAFVEAKKKEIELEEQIVEEIIPQLELKQKTLEKPYSAVVFKGVFGLKTALEEMLIASTKEDEYLAMGVISSKRETYNRYILNWHKERIKKGVPCRIVFSEKGKYFEQYLKMKQTRVGFLENVTPSAIGILGNKVGIFTFEDEPKCLLITSNDVSDSFKQFFISLWNISSEMN